MALEGPGSWSPRACEGPRGFGPRGPSPSAPTSGQRRCLGAAPGGCAACLVRPGRRPGAHGAHGWSRPLAVRKCKQCSCLRRDLGLSTHRAGWTGPTQPFDPGLCIFAVSAGRPRASPEPTVLLGDRAAVPCRPATTLERGPTTYGTTRTSHRSSKPRVVLSGPPLAGTDTSTNEAVRVAVTRRTGERRPELRCDPGTVRAASWRGTYRACRGPRCSGRGSPSRGTGSRAARRR